MQLHRRGPMRTTFFLLLIALCSSSLWAADKIIPPNIKTGLWETTESHNMTGMPAMPSIPPEALARMTPEQRAQIEARMKGGPKTMTRKYCMTKEKLEREGVFGEEKKECTRTVLHSSSTMTEVKVHCVEKDSSSDGTFKMEALSSEMTKGVMQMDVTTQGHTMHINTD